jgi:pimeloyl-ACP methyl ester carboxylesterase
MRVLVFSLVSILYLPFFSIAQTPGAGTVRTLEPCACPVQVDSSFHTRCAYLIVPENRKKNNGKLIKLPFILVNSKNPGKSNDPLLYTAGGPGGSSLGWIRGATQHDATKDRDCIAFEQRGTQYAVPNLWSNEISDAIKESYRKNLNKDSMVIVGVKRYRQSLESKGIDLSGYNTDETVSDIHDLLATLHIDSVNLTGGSYSGGLMLAVLQRDPSRIRSLILNSPLPTFVHIDEDEPANFNEALNYLFEHIEQDSADKARYGNLKARFQQYFLSIGNKTFTISYREKGTADTLNIAYTRNELLQVIEDAFGNPGANSRIAGIITDVISGKHFPYLKKYLDDTFENGNGPSGMRLSVYCADQAAYNDQRVIREINNAYPWMSGYHINDVDNALCDCWKVPPIDRKTKMPYYSEKPALLIDGQMDNACRPLYIDMIHHYMPSSQRLVFIEYAHMVGGPDLNRIMLEFLAHPYQKIHSTTPAMVAY